MFVFDGHKVRAEQSENAAQSRAGRSFFRG